MLHMVESCQFVEQFHDSGKIAPADRGSTCSSRGKKAVVNRLPVFRCDFDAVEPHQALRRSLGHCGRQILRCLRYFFDAEQFEKGFGKSDLSRSARLDQCSIDVKEYSDHKLRLLFLSLE